MSCSGEVPTDTADGDGEDNFVDDERNGNNVEVGVGGADEALSSEACPNSKVHVRVANKKKYFTARSLLLSSPFVLGQTLFNVVASFCGPLLCFWLLFSGGGPYAWNSGEVLGPIIASPLACAILAPAFVPIGMTDAVSKGWFGPVPSHDDGVRRLARFLPFLRPADVWRVGAVRHLVLGTQLSCVAIPPGILIARYALGPDLPAWTQIWFSVAYIALLPIVVLPLALLGFALEPNLERVENLIGAADDPRALIKLAKRAWAAPKC